MKGKLRVLVADDELMARKRLIRLLGQIPDVEMCGECVDGAEVLRRLAGNDVDVLLLDIRMPGLGGIETARQLSGSHPYVIFCTAHANHALAAFDVGAVDYLLKPIEAERLAMAIERARCRDPWGKSPASVDNQDGLTRLAIETRQGIVLVDPAEVSHAALEDAGLVHIVTTRGEYLTEVSLNELATKLPRSFMRVHRRALVNLQKIVRLEPVRTGGFLARMIGGAGVPVSRQASRELRQMLGLHRG